MVSMTHESARKVLSTEAARLSKFPGLQYEEIVVQSSHNCALVKDFRQVKRKL